MIVAFLGSLVAIYLVHRVSVIKNALSDTDKRLPRFITLLQPMSILGAILPKAPFYRNFGFPWYEKTSMYKDSDLKTIVTIPLFYGQEVVYTSSLAFLHQAVGVNGPLEKPDMSMLKMMGDNVVAAEGETWRRHRRITAPAFNHSTYRNVWETTTKVYTDCMEQEGWNDVDAVPSIDFNKITHKLALFIVSIVGFNIPMSWSEPRYDENGQLSVQAMVFEVASSILARSQIPKWAYYLGIRKLKTMDEAYTRFEAFIRERLAEREAQLRKLRNAGGTDDMNVAESINDIFGRLVNARLSEGKLSLSDEEIVGNCFVFTFAGHETTANTLAVTLALLALHPDKQQWVYDSIISVLGDRLPTFEDYDALTGVLACFYEALRLYPAVYMMGKHMARDFTFALPRRDQPDVIEQIHIEKGTLVYVDFIGMLYDPQSFPEPESFKPERWTSVLNPQASESIARDTAATEVSSSAPASSLEGFVGFSYGPRTCLGHKFAKVEAVAFLTLLLREWRVDLPLKKGVTRSAWRKKALNPSLGILMGIGEVPLKLVRRREDPDFAD